MLIVNAQYCPNFGKKQMAKTMVVRLLMSLLRYRYKDMELVYQALADFCKGPEWLMQVDAAAYHQKIIQMGYQMTDMTEKLKHCKQMKCSNLSEQNSIKDIFKWAARKKKMHGLLWQIITLNGWLLPPAKETKAFPMGAHPVDLFRTGRVVLYDDASMQGIEVRRSFCQIFVFLSFYIRSLTLICTKYDRSKADYQAKWRSLHDIKYWKSVYGQ